MQEVLDVLDLCAEQRAVILADLLGHVSTEVVLFEVLFGETVRFDRLTLQERETAFQASLDGEEGAREPAAVHGHDEAKAVPFRLVPTVEIADVLVDPVVELAFPSECSVKLDPLVARLTVGHSFGEQAPFVVAAKQRPRVSPHESPQRRVAPEQFPERPDGQAPERGDRSGPLGRAGETLQHLPIDRAKLPPCGLRDGGIDTTASVQLVGEHVQEEVPVSLRRRPAKLLEVTDELPGTGGPAPT